MNAENPLTVIHKRIFCKTFYQTFLLLNKCFFKQVESVTTTLMGLAAESQRTQHSLSALGDRPTSKPANQGTSPASSRDLCWGSWVF